MKDSAIDNFVIYKKGCGMPLPEHHNCLDEDDWEIVFNHFGPIRALIEEIIAHSAKNLEDIDKDVLINVEGLCLQLRLSKQQLY
tara:strand:- start:6983 stop:7234 length:252 start_codon:yes stop_codon:yes gene_type:complete